LMARFSPRDGSHALVRGRVSLYEQRGDYQFIADYMEEAGEGALRQRFELLKTKLAAEGLFALEHKRPLPRLPRRIGVITSPTGAALRDVLHILRRRFCTIPVLIYPVQVQGGVAAVQIARTIRRASARAECDVLILVRGGGSLEDLWAFNEESVARAIYACAVPVVTGIGHEVDFTIADFVADVRAPTPSGAAELVVPDCNEWLRNVLRLTNRLTVALTRSLKTQQDRAAWLQRRLAQLHPGVELRQRAQRLDDLEQRLIRVVRSNVDERRRTLQQLAAELRQHSPALRVANARSRLETARASIETAVRQSMEQLGRRLAVASRTLDAVSPLATLERGYAIVTDSKGTVVTNAQDVRAGQIIDARLTQGTVRARVERSTNPELDLRLPKSDEK
ncbi:MAG: exodeoxyribonuclease VII large subunit, partial [Steroidobacteraceae bacterium]